MWWNLNWILLLSRATKIWSPLAFVYQLTKKAFDITVWNYIGGTRSNPVIRSSLSSFVWTSSQPRWILQSILYKCWIKFIWSLFFIAHNFWHQIFPSNGVASWVQFAFMWTNWPHLLGLRSIYWICLVHLEPHFSDIVKMIITIIT